MRFLRVEIRDYRNFEAFELDLTDGSPDEPLPLAVLVGPNGSGKTAVLDACRRLSFHFAATLAQEGMRPLESEIRAGCNEASLAARYLPNEHEAKLFGGTRQPVDAALKIRLEGKHTAVDFMHDIRVRTDLDPPSIAYFDAVRHATREPIQSVTATAKPDARAAAAGGPTRFQWTKQQLVNMKFAQMLERERGGEERAFDKLWEPVHRVLERVRFREVTPELKIMFDTPSGSVEFDDLSSGEKSVVLMFTDLLVRRVSEAAILIDEIDLHLHPRWQHTILGALRELLPDCQLIVTTQSPIVAASVQQAKYLFKLGDLW